MSIQPVYIYGEQRTEIIDIRRSENYEISAMKCIREALLNKEETKAEILDIKYIDKSLIPANEEITEAYKKIHEVTGLGTQHEWLARYAFNNPGLATGAHNSNPSASHFRQAINKYGVLIKTEGTYKLDPEKSSKEGMLVLGNLTFPIIDMTELDMKKQIDEWGYQDIMQMIWFCHNPIQGKPCGVCHPCYSKIDYGMQYLLPENALKRNAVDRKYGDNSIYKLYKRMMRKTFWK